METFSAMSPVTTQGVASSMDISPGQQSFGFNMQRVATNTTAFNDSSPTKEEPVSGSGLSKLIEHMDSDQLGQNSKDLAFQNHSRQKSVEQRAAEKMMRRQQSLHNRSNDSQVLDRSYSSKENSSLLRSILRDERKSNDKSENNSKNRRVEEKQVSQGTTSEKQGERSLKDTIAEVSIIQPKETRPLKQCFDEVASRESKGVQHQDSVSNGSNRFKNNYLSQYQSVTSNQNKDDSDSQKLPGQPVSSNPYLSKILLDQAQENVNSRNPQSTNTTLTHPGTSAFPPKKSTPVPVRANPTRESHQNPLETSQSQNQCAEEDQDIVDDSLNNKLTPQSKSKYLGVPKKTDRPNQSKNANYMNIQDNSSFKNTAKYTDGTVSDTPLGTSGRGGTLSFNPKTPGSFKSKKNSLNQTKTDRGIKTTKKQRGKQLQGTLKQRLLDDQDLSITRAPITQDEKPRRQTQKKSSSYLNMTSSFKSKVENNLRTSLGPSNDLRRSIQDSMPMHATPHHSKPSSFLDQQGVRGKSQSGHRQPKQKRGGQTSPGYQDNEYASFGRGEVSADRLSQMKATVARLSSRERTSHCDAHCYEKHPDNWKWHANPPKGVILASNLSKSKSASKIH